MAKKIFKVIGKILLIILAVIVLGTAVLFIYHKIKTSAEEKMLAENGYLNLVSVGDYRLNVCSYGSDNPEHILVGLSGMGVSSYSAAMRGVTDRFADKNKIVFVDRAGYGLSDDTDVPMTTEQVVEDYRNALKNAGFDAPYIILPHSLGGIYTTYWVSKYPEEIEGIVYLDCTQTIGDEITFEDMKVTFFERIEMELCKVGYQRLFYKFVDPIGFYAIPEELYDINKALIMNKTYTSAMISETELVNQNCYFTYQNTVKTDVPKVYICSANAMQTADDIQEMIAMMNALQEKSGGKLFSPPEDTEAFLDGAEEFRREVVYPYAEIVGNCEVKLLNGTHMLYYHKPKETGDIIEEFLDKLDRSE